MVSDCNFAAKSQSGTIVLRAYGVKAAISDWPLLAHPVEKLDVSASSRRDRKFDLADRPRLNDLIRSKG